MQFATKAGFNLRIRLRVVEAGAVPDCRRGRFDLRVGSIDQTLKLPEYDGSLLFNPHVQAQDELRPYCKFFKLLLALRVTLRDDGSPVH